eukprot:10137312-Prorocentrum_lima.AAC.1
MQTVFFQERADLPSLLGCVLVRASFSVTLPFALSDVAGLGRTIADEASSNEEDAAEAEACCDL